MALEGSLRDFDLFSLFNMIKTQGKSGTLVLSRGQEFVKIFFDQGEIVGCDSNQVRLEDRIGAMLVRMGRLSGEELLAMIQKQRQTMKRMGNLLLEAGHISSQDLEDALFNQAMSIIYRTFRWVEGDYRFDSMLPPDMDRENFPPIPVDTVLMEAARIMDEWPEVQRRLPEHTRVLQKTAQAQSLSLDMDRDFSGVLDGASISPQNQSGLSFEQETILTYFSEPQNIQGVLLITRFDELETCKVIADLMEMGLLEASRAKAPPPVPSWKQVEEARPKAEELPEPSFLLWPLLILMLAIPLLTYVPRGRHSFNQGLASLELSGIRLVSDPMTLHRMQYALAMASPSDSGRSVARLLKMDPVGFEEELPNFLKMSDPMGIKKHSAAPAKKGKKAGRNSE